MQKYRRSMLTLLLSVCAAPAWAAAPVGVEDLAWMTGSWGSQQNGAWVEEHWLAPRGGIMLGANRSGDGRGAKAFEFLRIEAGPDGIPVYWAAPQGGAARPFRQIASAAGSVTFENRSNAYPTRIVYRLSGDTLEAAIEGPNGDHPMSWSWRRLARPD